MRRLKWLLAFLLLTPVAAQEINLIEHANRVYRHELKKIKGVQRMGAARTTKWGGTTSGDAAIVANWTNRFARGASDTIIVPKTSTQAITSNLGAIPSEETLTFGGQPNADEVVVIDAKTYTFKVAITGGDNVDGNVKIGADTEGSLDNLVSAINLTSGAGSTYAAAMTVHTTFYATDEAGTTMDAIAKIAGTAANGSTTTTDVTAASWGAGTTSGGAATGLALALVFIHDGYTQDIMTSGTPAQLFANRFMHQGSGAVYLQPTNEGAIICNSSNFSNAITVSGSLSLATSGSIEIVKGKVIYSSTGTMGRTYIAGNTAELSITNSATFTTIFMNDGTLTSAGTITNMNISGGLLDYSVGNMGALWQYGGTVDAKDCNGGDWVIVGGVLDTTNSVDTVSIAALTVFPSGTVIDNPDLSVFTTRRNIGE